MHAQRRVCHECGHDLGAGVDRLEVGHLIIDGLEHTVTWKGREVRLTPIEFKLIELFASRAGQQIQKHVPWTIGIFGDDTEQNMFQVYICKLRKIFREVDPEFDQIKLVWGSGYRWAR